jgi:PAS domain S-box-containing protein
MKIFYKILLSFLGTFVVIFIFGIFIFSDYIYKQARIDAEQKIEIALNIKQKRINDFIEEKKKDFLQSQKVFDYKRAIQLLPLTKEKTNNDDIQFLEFFTNALQKHVAAVSELHHFVLSDKEGRILFTSDDIQDKDYLGNTVQNKISNEAFEKFSHDVSFSNIIRAGSNGENSYSMAIGMPIKDENNGVLGIVSAEVCFGGLFSFMETRDGMGASGETYLVGRDNILRSKCLFLEKDTILSKTIETKNVDYCFSKKEFNIKKGENIFQNYNGETVFGNYAYIPELDWCLVAEISKKDVFSWADRLLGLVLLGGIVIMILFFIVSFSLSKMILNPLSLLLRNVYLFGSGNFSARTPIKTKDEIEFLSNTFNSIAEKLETYSTGIEEQVDIQTKVIKKQKKEAEKLAIERKKFYLAVKNSSDHIVILDPELKVIYANEAAQNITGYEEKEILGKKISDLWESQIPERDFSDLWDTIKREKKPQKREILNMRKNGSFYIAHTRITPIVSEDIKEVLFFVMLEEDITKRKEVDRMKNNFIDIASHELKTPMTLIRGYASIILEEFSSTLPETTKKHVHQILINVERLISLVSDMLDISRIESGKMESLEKKQEMNIVDSLNEVQKSFSQSFATKGIKFIVKCSKKINPTVFYSEEGMRIIFTNLIGNSIKFVPENKGIITVKITEKDENSLLVMLSDNGIGIQKEYHEKVFQKFGVANAPLNHGTGGTGLGLSIVKMIVEKNGGKIWVESSGVVGEGVKFYFTLPKKSI